MTVNSFVVVAEFGSWKGNGYIFFSLVLAVFHSYFKNLGYEIGQVQKPLFFTNKALEKKKSLPVT